MLLAVLASGCGESAPPPGVPAQERPVYQGVVDTTLGPSLQMRQTAVLEAFSVIQDGVPPDQVSRVARGITVRESSQDFFDGAVRLVRWRFNGKPQGDEVPVELRFAMVDEVQEQDQKQRVDQRTYKVSGAPGALMISRKK